MTRARVPLLVLASACGTVPAAPDAMIELACLDGADNDGDGFADCADPDCEALTRCLPETAEEVAGVLVASDVPCPPGFTGGERVVRRGLVPGPCDGCECSVGPTTCAATVWYYDASLEQCDNDAAMTGGVLVDFQITDSCSPTNLVDTTIYGVRADIVPTGTCTASGSGTPGASTWSETVKFCTSSHVAAGCDPGAACVALAVRPDDQCALSANGACSAAYSSTQEWYTSYEDQRTCGACRCDAVGADCDNVLVQVGSDYTCINESQVADDSKECFPPFGIYSPPAMLIGSPTPAPTCTADAPTQGAITPTGQTTLCCAPS